MLINLLVWLVFGLIVGALARAVVPGRGPVGCFATAALGIVGSMVGGYLGTMLPGHALNEFQPAGFLGALLGAVLVLGLLRLLTR